MANYENLTAVPLDLPARETFNKNKLAFIVDDVFSKEECDEMIKTTEKQGYCKALVNVGGGRQKLMPEVRNNDRCIVDSFEKSAEIWDRIKHLIPEQWKGRKVLGLNERLRFLRYDPGQQFKPHFDGSYLRENGEISYLTVQLYLNEGFKGGATTFLENHRHWDFGDNDVDCVPKIVSPSARKSPCIVVMTSFGRPCSRLSTRYSSQWLEIKEREKILRTDRCDV